MAYRFVTVGEGANKAKYLRSDSPEPLFVPLNVVTYYSGAIAYNNQGETVPGMQVFIGNNCERIAVESNDQFLDDLISFLNT